MAKINQFLLEGLLLIALGFILTFSGFNVDQQLATSFGVLALIWVIFLVLELAFDKFKADYPLFDGKNLDRSIYLAIGGFIILIIFSPLLQGLKFTLENSLLSLKTLTFAERTAGLLENNPFLMIVLFVGVITIIETMVYFVRSLEFFLKVVMKKNPQTVSLTNNFTTFLGISLIMAGLFTITHLTAKLSTGIGSGSLLVVLLFSLVTAGIIFIEKKATGAILLHIIANGSAIVYGLGAFSALLTIITVIGAIALLIYISRKSNLVVGG